MKLFVALFLMLAVPAYAGDDCHISAVTPIITDWTITAGPMGLVIDAKLAARSECCPPAQFYAESPTNEAEWVFSIWSRALGETGGLTQWADHGAVVTDSTFHLVQPHPAGTFTVYAAFGGMFPGETDLCTGVYFRTDTLTIESPTPARRVSFGAARSRWKP